jgi:hypothetical protein
VLWLFAGEAAIRRFALSGAYIFTKKGIHISALRTNYLRIGTGNFSFLDASNRELWG